MKKTVNFRFSEEAHSALQKLADTSGLTRTHVLEDLVLHPDAPWCLSIPVFTSKVSEDVRIREEVEGPCTPKERADHLLSLSREATGLGDFKNDPVDEAGRPVLRNEPKPRMKSVRPDPEKIAAAQKAFGMGGVKKK